MPGDYHIHSYFSGDSGTIPEQNILAAAGRGLDRVCFTEHLDMDYPYDDVCFDLDTDAYFAEISMLKEKFAGKIEVYTGVELGLQPHLGTAYNEWLRGRDFDFIIGSTHLVDRMDPYYPDFWEGRNADDGIRRYLEATLENITAFDDFDVYGHLDYIVRYVPGCRAGFDYAKYADEVDAVLELLIEKGKGIEVNTGGYRAGLADPNPCADVVRRFRELGGRIITTGSDAHTPDCVGFGFDDALSLIRKCGFNHTTYFRGRKAFDEAIPGITGN